MSTGQQWLWHSSHWGPPVRSSNPCISDSILLSKDSEFLFFFFFSVPLYFFLSLLVLETSHLPFKLLSAGIYYGKSSSHSTFSEVPTPKAQVAVPQGFHGCRRSHLPTAETAFASPFQCHLKGCCLLPALPPSCDPSSPVHLHGPMHPQKGFSHAGEARLKMGNFLKVSLENSFTTPYHKKIMTAPIFNSHHPSVPAFLPSLILYLFSPVPTASDFHHSRVPYLCLQRYTTHLGQSIKPPFFSRPTRTSPSPRHHCLLK